MTENLLLKLSETFLKLSSALKLFLSINIEFCIFAKNPKKNHFLISDFATKHTGNSDDNIIISKYEQWLPTKTNGLRLLGFPKRDNLIPKIFNRIL